MPDPSFYYNSKFSKIELERNLSHEKQSLSKSILLIGTNTLFIRDNVHINGYTTTIINSIEEAKNILLSTSFKCSPPDAIICDIQITKHSINHFGGFLLSIKKFSYIPFLLLIKDDHELTKIDINGIHGIDDVICCTSSATDLVDKIEILKKYKNFKRKFPYPVSSSKKLPVSLEGLSSRIIDIFFALTFLVLLSPIMLLIAILIKIESRGPVLYTSPRAGKGYRIFEFYKFRTMIVNADKMRDGLEHLNQYNISKSKDAIFFKIDQDPRVTRLGHFLRNTSLDELPQLINVFIGDMCLVGNRPLPLYEACSLTVDEAAKRFLAPAGMTGLWQIKKRGYPNMSVQERIGLDIDYANKHSFLFDMQILLNTPKGLIQKN